MGADVRLEPHSDRNSEPGMRAQMTSSRRCVAVHARRALHRFVISLGAVVVFTVLLWLLSAGVALVRSDPFPDPRGPLLAGSLCAIAWVSYAAWPSLRNVPTHLFVAFTVPAYIVPLIVNRQIESGEFPTIGIYTALCAIGAVAVLIGVSIGAELPTPVTLAAFLGGSGRGLNTISRRTTTVVIAGLVGLSVAFTVMGFIPALASDPLDAKFLRGQYATSYNDVAPLYRLSTAMLIAFLPLTTMFAVWRRRWWWWALLAISVVALVLTLQRGAAIVGVLLFLGAVAARRRRLEILFILGVVVFYTFGSVSYVLLGTLGLGAFGSSAASGGNVWIAIQQGAPDVYDHLTFLTAWTRHPEMTWGRTMFGGLVPGHFTWNPAVWTLAVANPGADINSLTSGGFRLPAPVWGLVDFGWPGVVLLPLLSGVLTGYLTVTARRTLRPLTGEAVVIVYVVWSATQSVASQFFTLDYQSVIELAALLVAVYLGAQRFRGAPVTDSGRS